MNGGDTIVPRSLRLRGIEFSGREPLYSISVNSMFKSKQEWKFFWLRFWILYYFIVSYA